MSATDPLEHPIHIFHHSFSQGGGVERYSREFANELVRRGRQVKFHARRIDDRISIPTGLEVEPVRSGMFPRKMRDFFYHRAIRRLGADLPGTQFAMTRVPARDGEICGGTHRGYLRRARKFIGVFDRLQVWMELQSYHFTRRMISHSHLCANELRQLYNLPSEKIVTIHPPADVQRFKVPTDERRALARQQLGLPKDKIVLAFPSSGHKRKGLYPLIDACREFGADVVLAVTGKPPGRVPEFVRHLGYVDDIADVYIAADFTAMASYYEPFGQVGVESILCGTRLLFEEAMGCLEVIKGGAAFTFNVWHSNTIRRAISEAIELAKTNQHRLEDPAAHLSYDPSVEHHVTQVMAALEKPKA